MSGRPTRGADLVDQLSADAIEKERLKVILMQLTGELGVKDACARIGVKPSRYFELREQALQGAVRALEPKPAGRPRKAALVLEDVQHLRREADELRRENFALRVKQEVLESLPLSMQGSRPTGAVPEKRGAGRGERRARRGKGRAR